MAKVTLDKALKKYGLSRRQFAKRRNTDYKNVARMFRPDYNPRVDSLAESAKAIGCKIKELIKD